MASREREPALLGIDIGTSGVKLLVYFLGRGSCSDAARTRVARAPLRVRHPEPGYSEMAPEAWWRAVCRAASRLDLADVEVLGIGLSTLFPALVAVGPQGRPVRPAILYDDLRSAAEVEEFERRPVGRATVQIRLTGNRIRPGTISLSSLLWMRKHEPRLFQRARRFGHAGSYLGRRLTGRFAIDATNASLTGLYATASGEARLRIIGDAAPTGLPRPSDREAPFSEGAAATEGGWVKPLLDAAGLEQDRLPEVVWPGERLGKLTEGAAGALGLEPGIPVAAGAGDTACAALGLGLADEQEMAVTCGSTDSLTSLQRTPVFDGSTLNIAYMDEGTWLSIAPMNATGAAVDWFAGTLFGRGRKRYERFFALAAQAPAASKGVVFLPYLAGERSPVYDPAAKGVFFGLTLETGRAEMARAILEGVAFGHRQILKMADVRLGRPVERVIAAGGGTGDPLWRQIRADAADRIYLYADLADTSAFGAALLGGMAAGVFGSWQEAAADARARVQFDEVRPEPEAWQQLQRNFRVYSSLYGALRGCL